MTTLNPFAETELLETVPAVTSDNPYASPTDTQKGVWDHTLFWTFMKWMGGIVAVLLVVDVLALTKGNIASITHSQNIVDAIIEQLQQELSRLR